MKKFLILYSILDLKKRKNILTILSFYGLKVNKNAFELIIKESDLEKLLLSIEKIIDKKNDSFRVYFIDEASIKKSFTITKENKPFTSNPMIV